PPADREASLSTPALLTIQAKRTATSSGCRANRNVIRMPRKPQRVRSQHPQIRPHVLRPFGGHRGAECPALALFQRVEQRPERNEPHTPDSRSPRSPVPLVSTSRTTERSVRRRRGVRYRAVSTNGIGAVPCAA